MSRKKVRGRKVKEGHFPPGSRGPKIQASIMFLEQGEKNVIITSPGKATDAILGKTGTHIVRE